ncbi:MAG: histidine kinase [Candidatus Solibacter sp.]|nr:histidine kinase [Candidatus Solibacter sp.]
MTAQCVSVLIIEDNPDDAWLAREVLQGTSEPAYRVEWADTLTTGLTRLAEGGIDVLLLDLGLPDSRGPQALTLISHLAPAVPVVVLTGADDEQLAMDAMREGAQDYLVKSHADSHLLTHTIRYAIERKRAAEALRISEERLRLAVLAANEAIWEYDPVKGIPWNKAYEGLSGITPEAASVAEFCVRPIHPDDRDRVFRSFAETLEGRALSWRAEYRLKRADGEWSHIHDRAIIARDRSGQATRVVGAMLDVSDLKRSEEALRASNRKLQQLSRDLLRAQDYERRRIARELHDSTAQLLAALSINLTRLQDGGLEPERRSRVLSEAVELAAACSAEIRTVTCLLHPPLLQELGLVSALQSYAQGFNQRTGIHVELKIPADFCRLSLEVEATLFRIVQEGLANVHKHSGSQLAVVRLEQDSQEVRLVLQDRGRGLPEVLQDQAEGYVRFGVGVIGMRERAEQLGGRLELTSNKIGARLIVVLPLVHSNDENANIVGG